MDEIVLDAGDISNILWALNSFMEPHSEMTYYFNGINILHDKMIQLKLDINAKYIIKVELKEGD